MTPSRDIARLLEIMAALRTPGTGCPWDLEQNFATIAPYTLEEAYEVADAIARGDLDDLREELGDLLLQVVFHARMAQEQGAFDFGDVVEAITEKLCAATRTCSAIGAGCPPRRSRACGSASRPRKRPSAARGGRPETPARWPACRSALPALTRALKLQAKAGKVGFDWNDPLAVLAKIREEADEIEAEIEAGDATTAAAEVGDLLFAVVNLARHLDADPEATLRATNREIRAPLRRRSSARWPRAARRPQRLDARRDGRAVGRGQGGGEVVRATRTPAAAQILQIDEPLGGGSGGENAPASPMNAMTCDSPFMSISACCGSTPRSGSK